MGVMKTIYTERRARPVSIRQDPNSAGILNAEAGRLSVDFREWDSLMRSIKDVPRRMHKTILNQSMRPETRKVMQEMKTNARRYARKGRKTTRRKAVRSLMRIVASKLKMRALKRSRKRVAGLYIFIAASGPEIEAARGLNPASRWYAPVHFHMGHKKRGSGAVVTGRKFMSEVADRMSPAWYEGVARRVHARVLEEIAKTNTTPGS